MSEFRLLQSPTMKDALKASIDIRRKVVTPGNRARVRKIERIIEEYGDCVLYNDDGLLEIVAQSIANRLSKNINDVRKNLIFCRKTIYKSLGKE